MTVHRKRPMSPHLQIYQWSVLMALSILHRLSGIALYGAFILFVGWLAMLNIGGEWYNCYNEFLASWLGRLVLFLATWALMHHMAGGIRHFIWDMGYNFEPEKARAAALILSILAFVLTIVVWWIGYQMV